MADGDGWVVCAAGHRHWGRHGAAGLLLAHRARDEDTDRVLLTHRVWWSHHGGTWGIPGGARAGHEGPESAALREVVEETGLDPAAVELGSRSVDDHGGWSYVTMHARLARDDAPDLVPTDGESTELRWVPVTLVAALDLHPGFATFWATADLPRT